MKITFRSSARFSVFVSGFETQARFKNTISASLTYDAI